MSKVEEYLKEWKKLQRMGYNHSVIGEPKLTENNAIKFAEAYHQVKLEEVTEENIKKIAWHRYIPLAGQNEYFVQGAIWMLEQLKTK